MPETSFLRISNPDAESASLWSYNEYSVLTLAGDRFGISTFAPASSPSSLPWGEMLAREVVDGINEYGNMSLSIEMRFRVLAKEPACMCANGVPCAGMKGPIPIMSG